MSQHILAFEEDFLDDGVKATCSCGWESKSKADQESARMEFENHRTFCADLNTRAALREKEPGE